MTTPAPLPSTIVQFGTMAPWQALTVYALGVRVLNGAEIYQVNAQGTSGNAGGPVGVGVAIADPGSGDGLTWDSVVPLTAAWQAAHAYLKGDVVTNDGGKIYTCIAAGTSAGAGGPTGAPTSPNVIADGTVAWSYTSTGIAQQTVPTSRVQDIGAVPGAPLFAQYLNAIFANLFAWILYLRDLAGQAWTWTGNNIFTGTNTFRNSVILATSGGSSGFINDTSTATTWVLFSVKTNGAGDQVREFHGDGKWCRTVNAQWNDGTAKWSSNNNANASTMMFLDEGTVSERYKAPTAGTWNDGVGAGAWTEQSAFNLNTGALAVTGSVTTGAVTATGSGGLAATGGPVVASTTVTAQTARSSATVGAGQSVAAGVIYKDTTCFAWGKVTVSAAAGGSCTLARGVNVAGQPAYVSPGVYDVTLQTAAANLLSPTLTVLDATARIITIDNTGVPPTTTTFRVLLFNIAGGATDPSGGANTGGFYFEVRQG